MNQILDFHTVKPHPPIDWRAQSDSKEAPRGDPEQLGILVVDDEALVRALLEAFLQRNGFTAWFAADGKEALDLYGQHAARIDLVLMDVCMPGLDGKQTLAALQDHDPAVRCCFMSGGTGPYTRDDLLGQGALDLLCKPFALGDLLAKLRQWTDQAARRECS
jgi:DNA-binding response OmpR family regulator